ncbi:MAG: DUF2313 domain-containing protein [Clostridia bacterium]|nr:DUF2313 domain-containing protein [Clostridia bacterium]
MRNAGYLKDLLRPLGIYRLEDGIGAGELESAGAALDGCTTFLEELQREMLLLTAEGDGLNQIESLLSRRPVTTDPKRRREALAALLRVGGDSFTLAAINDNLKGCGLNAVASECEAAGTVEVRFPEVPGIPNGFEDMKGIIEDILPCHLPVLYVFWYITWAMMEERFRTWGDVEAMGLTWEELEKLVK